MRRDWMLDEAAHAGPDHLDPEAVARYDRKQGDEPDRAARADVEVLRAAGIDATSTVVDLGAGTGRFALAVARHVGRVIAVDVSPAMVAHLERRVEAEGVDNVEVVRGGLLSYEHTGPAVDAVHMRNVLHQLPDLFKVVALRRIAGILRPGGVLRLRDLILECSPDELDGVIGRWLEGAPDDPADGYTAADLAEHLREEYSTFSWLLRPMLEATGFTVVDVTASATFGAYSCVRAPDRADPTPDRADPTPDGADPTPDGADPTPDGAASSVGRIPVGDLATPVPIVHRDRLLTNLATWSDTLAAKGVALRPHAKTHKTVEVARLQLEHGAHGLTVAKPSEGLALLPSGVQDVFVAYPIAGPARTAELLALAARVRVSSTIDHLDAASALSAAAVEAGRTLDVLVDVDSGLRRTGLPPEEAVYLGVAAQTLPGLRVCGVFSYAGYPAMDPDPEELRAWAHQEASTAVQVADALRDHGVEIERVSVGGTPTSLLAADVDGVTEVRPGIYAFGDANDSRVGAMGMDDCALRILTTVVSRPAPDRIVIDAGTKTLAADAGLDGTFGCLPEHPEARFTGAWEEHGVVELGRDAGVRGGADLQVGDRIEVIPNHVCPAVNLASHLVCIDGDQVMETWEVIAR